MSLSVGVLAPKNSFYQFSEFSFGATTKCTLLNGHPFAVPAVSCCVQILLNHNLIDYSGKLFWTPRNLISQFKVVNPLETLIILKPLWRLDLIYCIPKGMVTAWF